MSWFKRVARAMSRACVPLLLTALPATAQASGNALSSSADVVEGERLFLKNCALCHGGDATGGRGPDLTRGFFRHATSDDQLLEIVQQGIVGTGMPWMGLSDRKAAQLVAFIQFTPHDTHDWDATQIPVLVDLELGNEVRKLMLWANRNAFYYVLDRETGQFLRATAYAKQTWTEGMDEDGRPILIPDMDPTEEGIEVYPSVGGATNWNSPSFSPASGLFYTFAYAAADIFYKRDDVYEEGDTYLGGFGKEADHSENFTAAIRALDPLTGELQWEYGLDTSDWRKAGILFTFALPD